MGDAKRIEVQPIGAADANRVVMQHHYSGKIVRNSQLHLGVFLDGRCGGAMQFGPSLDKRKVQTLVDGTPWNGFLELNRMAFADWLPRNSESRAIGFALRWIRRTYPFIQWIVSFSDACQCGDGTIYRASGFVLTGIKKNTTLMQFPDGEKIADLSIKLSPEWQQKRFGRIIAGQEAIREARRLGAKPLVGFQMRYLYFLDPAVKARLTVPILPFSEIDRHRAGMYLGKPRARSIVADAPGHQPGEDGAAPIRAL